MPSPTMIVYAHPTCTTCKKALKWLDLEGYRYEVLDIRQTRPTAQEMLALKERRGLTWTQLFNTSGDLYRSQGIKDKLGQLNDQEAAELLVSDGMMMKRPIVRQGDLMSIGAKESELEKVWRNEHVEV